MLSEGNLENQDFGGNRGFDESHLSLWKASNVAGLSAAATLRIRLGFINNEHNSPLTKSALDEGGIV